MKKRKAGVCKHCGKEIRRVFNTWALLNVNAPTGNPYVAAITCSRSEAHVPLNEVDEVELIMNKYEETGEPHNP